MTEQARNRSPWTSKRTKTGLTCLLIPRCGPPLYSICTYCDQTRAATFLASRIFNIHGKKKNVYFCNRHIKIVSTIKAMMPVHHTAAQTHGFVLLPGHSEHIRETVFLTIFALAAVLLAVATYNLRAGVKHDIAGVTILLKGRLAHVDKFWLFTSGFSKS